MSTPAEHDSQAATPPVAAETTPMDIDTQTSTQKESQGEVQTEVSNGEAASLEDAQKNEASAKEDEPVDLEKVRAEFQEKARTYLIEQSRHVVVPSFAKWFDMNEIHAIERNLFPDFFPVPKGLETDSEATAPVSVYKTAETYRNMRDFIINTYRINPVEYLTVTAVRRNLAGDVASIIRVHRFLEKWGLINYQIDPRTKPSLVGPQYTGHFQITLDTPKGLTPFVPEEIAVTTDSASEKPVFPDSEATLTPSVAAGAENAAVKDEPQENTTIPLNIDVTRNIFDEVKTTKTPTSVTYLCNETANDVSDVRYHNLKSKALAGSTIGPLVISKECYEQGLFPLNFSASDFVKLENASKLVEWSRQEVLLLLEGIEMFGSVENNPQSLFVNSNGQWDKISEHVASKSREECLIKFLNMPIEDRYLQKLVRGEEKDGLDEGFNKDTIIQEVVAKLIETPRGQEVVRENGEKNLHESVLDQTNLVNQVIELTLEKFEAKMKYISQLEKDLVKTESLLNAQRKQVLVERWLNFEKLSKFKQNNSHPELTPLLDDLLTPVSINEINENLNRTTLDAATETTVAQASEEAKEENLPVSVAEPKAYQFWSA